MFYVFILHIMLMYDHQLVSSERNTKSLLPHLQSLGMRCWSFLPILKGGLSDTIFNIVNMEHNFSLNSSCIFTTTTLNPLMASPSSNDDLLSNLNPQFAGLFQRLSLDKEEDVPSATEVVDDYEGEQESLDLQNGTDKTALVITTMKMMLMTMTTKMLKKKMVMKGVWGFRGSKMW